MGEFLGQRQHRAAGRRHRNSAPTRQGEKKAQLDGGSLAALERSCGHSLRRPRGRHAGMRHGREQHSQGLQAVREGAQKGRGIGFAHEPKADR